MPLPLCSQEKKGNITRDHRVRHSVGCFAEQQGHLEVPKPIAPPTGTWGYWAWRQILLWGPSLYSQSQPRSAVTEAVMVAPWLCCIQGHFNLTRLQPQLPLPPRCWRWMDGGHCSFGPGPLPPTHPPPCTDNSQGGGGAGSHQHVINTDLNLGTLQAVKRHREAQLAPKLTQPCRESCPPRSTSPPRAP